MFLYTKNDKWCGNMDGKEKNGNGQKQQAANKKIQNKMLDGCVCTL